jgi:4-cresol dehydrogenase (hydroxylating)
LGGEAVDRAFKWGIGPYLDGLFAQGNFAIVTQATIALARRPQRTEAFLFGIDDAGVEKAIPAVQQVLRSLEGVTGSIKLINARGVLATTVPYPRHRVGDKGILPPEAVAQLAHDNGIMAWTGFGSLYGEANVVKAARRVIRKILKPIVRRLVFVSPGTVMRLNRWLARIPGVRQGRMARRVRTLDASLKLIAGIPSEVALPLAYWKSTTSIPRDGALDPARDGCGLIWYPPLVPMKPARVRRFLEMTAGICASYGIEPLITLTSMSDRCFDSTVPLLFDRRDSDQAARAQSCYRELFESGRREGFLPYRMSVHAMDSITRPNTPFWDMVATIKSAIDPTGIIAPGRYAPQDLLAD